VLQEYLISVLNVPRVLKKSQTRHKKSPSQEGLRKAQWPLAFAYWLLQIWCLIVFKLQLKQK